MVIFDIHKIWIFWPLFLVLVPRKIYQYRERGWARCMAYGDDVFGYVGPITTVNKEIQDEVAINFDDCPLHNMSFIKGNVTELSQFCCGVKWDAWETHLPKSALRKTD